MNDRLRKLTQESLKPFEVGDYVVVTTDIGQMKSGERGQILMRFPDQTSDPLDPLIKDGYRYAVQSIESSAQVIEIPPYNQLGIGALVITSAELFDHIRFINNK